MMQTDKKRPRKPYQKPELKVIELVAEEVLGIGCKNDSSSAPSGFTCMSNNCQINAS